MDCVPVSGMESPATRLEPGMHTFWTVLNRRSLVVAVFLLTASLGTQRSSAQMRDADPKAVKAFAKVIAAVRKVPRTVEEDLVVTTREGELEESAPKLALRWTNVPKKGMKAEFGGFSIRLADGRLQAIHDSRDDLAVDIDDRGSPYYALFSQFRDLPWPGLAMAIGEVKPEDCAMQLHSRAPWLQPTGLVPPVEGEPDSNLRIEFSSDIERMWIDVDPKTDLPRKAEVVIHGGQFVPEGVELVFAYRWIFGPVEDPAAAIALSIVDRERVDAVGLLEGRNDIAAEGLDGGGLLPGRKAPLFELSELDAEAEDVSLLALRGRVVVLDFWATWCGPCRAALPRMAELGRWARENGIPVEVIAVNTSEQSRTLDNRRKRIRDFVTEQRLDADGMRILLDLDGSVADAYAVRGLPTTVVLDAAGQVVTVKTGFGPGSEERLKQDLLDLFEGGDPAPAEGDGLT